MEESIARRMAERSSVRHEAVPGKTYRVEVCDYYSDEATCKTLWLPVEYPDIESASAAARAIIHALATFNGLEFENQGDQYMAYYPGGHEKEGIAVYTAAVYDEAGERYDP